jgi:Ni/Co efflux regulator RcnB
MNTIGRFLALSVLASGIGAGALYAQDHHDDGRHHDHPYVRHDEWRKDYHMNHDDWNRGERIDYRTYHLQSPPRGYEWREVDGNYVLGAVATGIIASAIVASTIH